MAFRVGVEDGEEFGEFVAGRGDSEGSGFVLVIAAQPKARSCREKRRVIKEGE